MKNEKLEKLLKLTKEEKRKLTNGAEYVVMAYNNSWEYDYLVIKDGWAKFAEEMINCIKECGIKKFIFADTSTEALAILTVFIKNGAKITGTEVYEVVDWVFTKQEYEGLVIEL